MIVETVCKKVIKQINLPEVIINEVLQYCSWQRNQRTMYWYIIASNIDHTCLIRAKEIDKINVVLACDDEDDMYYVFRNKNNGLALLQHMTMYNIL